MKADFARCKFCESLARPQYDLGRSGIVWACTRCRAHYVDYLDDEAAPAPEPNAGALRKHFDYIDGVLHSNKAKFEHNVACVARHVELRGARCLDVGAGGGYFLQLLRGHGAEAEGIEPDAANRAYARERYGLQLDARLLEDPHWQVARRASFDVVTLWDVIEHVNRPVETLRACVQLLRPDGIVCLDTPLRDAFLYRAGLFGYRVTRGRARSLLAAQYSRLPFGHKQIFATRQMREVVAGLGLAIVEFQRLHELSFPCRVYLQRILRSARAARVCEPLAAAFFRVMPVRNKMIVVARKTALAKGNGA